MSTMDGFGEALPFPDARFDVVACDNVVDHADDPRQILDEIHRVLAPGGVLFFSVNVHHRLFHVLSMVAPWFPFEIRPFADHTFHLTYEAALALLGRFRILSVRHRRRFKNGRLDVVAAR